MAESLLGMMAQAQRAERRASGKIVGKTKEGRPIVDNGDGTYSTEKTITVTIGGRHFNIPTMYGGREVNGDEAIEILRQNNWIDPDTGKRIESFDTAEQAERAARKRTEQLGDELRKLGL